MGYKELDLQTNEIYEERLELVVERLEEIAKAKELKADYADYFRTLAEYLLVENEIASKALTGALYEMTEEEGKAINDKLFSQFKK